MISRLCCLQKGIVFTFLPSQFGVYLFVRGNNVSLFLNRICQPPEIHVPMGTGLSNERRLGQGLETATGPACLRDCCLITGIGQSFQLNGPAPVGERR